MSDTNSIWPNGMGVDENGYAVFYPIGTNKVEIPKNSPHWPKGNKLMGQFVYKDDKLVGFCDTKAMTATSGDIIVMPYETIDTEFDSISSGSIQIHAPKAVVKKASWTGSNGKIDIPDIDYKYKGCTNIDRIKAVDANYLENDIVDGKWTELLSDLTSGNNMFDGCLSIITFDSDLSSLKNLQNMFYNCSNLEKFNADMSSLTYGRAMFSGCSKLSTIETDLSSLSNASLMFQQCLSLQTFNHDLKSLTYGYSMFNDCTSLITFNSDLSSLVEGDSMFYCCENLTNFECVDLSSLTIGRNMFSDCSNLVSFAFDLKSLTDGGGMFNNCSNLISFESHLDSLSSATNMFNGCSNLTTFKCLNMSSLKRCPYMFIYCSSLSRFESDMSSLTDGYNMFGACSKISSFKSNLNSLSDGQFMFGGCSSLVEFDCKDLSSLTKGLGMFTDCKLDVPSIKNIIDGINTVETGKITIGMGCDNNVTDKDLFAQEVGYADMTSLLETLQSKGWTVSAQYNGRPTSNYSLRQPESLPVYVKLIEVMTIDEVSSYEYTSQDGYKFYNLDWFHETTGSTDTYTQFSSLEEAITHFNIKPIEK